MIRQLALAAGLLATLSVCTTARAADPKTIDFDDRSSTVTPLPATFATAGPAQTVVYDFGGYNVTFSGGVLLQNSDPNDLTPLYGSASAAFGGDPTLQNPVTITFTTAVTGFYLDLLASAPGNYELTDNAGDAPRMVSLFGPTDAPTVGLDGPATVFTLKYLGDPDGLTTPAIGSGWRIGLDNVGFTPTGPVPEPASSALLIAGLALVGGVVQRRLRRRSA